MEAFQYLSNTVSVKTVREDATHGVFEIEGLFAGYGLTLGNALRRILLSSLPGAAVTQFKVKGIPHEFSTSPGVKEDMVELALNFKRLRFRMHTDEPQILTLKARGERLVSAGDIKTNAQVDIVNPDEVIAHLTDKNADLDIEIEVRKGLGYWPVEARKGQEKLAIGTIAIDSLFSPVVKVNYEVQDMRVGDRTDYNRLRIEVETDGIISPSSALHKAASILQDHCGKILTVPIQQFESSETPKGTGVKRRATAKKVKETKQE